MRFWHFFYQRGLVFLLALFFVLPLASCSRGGGGEAGAGVGSATLSWVAPTQKEDSSALSLAEITGYRIYYGTTSGSYPESVSIYDPAATEAQLTGVPSGAYFVAMTTLGADGLESAFSSEVLVKI